MAKRKRLTPAQPGFLGAPSLAPSLPVSSPPPASQAIAPPIAQVAGDSAIRAALDEVSGVLQDARTQGRMIEALPLAAIDPGYLVRDRLVQDQEEMNALTDSLIARGQQTPIEVIALPVSGDPDAPRYGLISGWRRLTALSRLYQRAETQADQDRFATIKALVITPGSARGAYVAMVEENEIRVNLSLYERARIALRAMHEEVYPTTRAALQGLFGATTRSKRSKIGTFVALVEALDDTLTYPTAIPEKLGLGLAREIARDPEFSGSLKVRLRSAPPETAEAELDILAAAVSAASRPGDTGSKNRSDSKIESEADSDSDSGAELSAASATRHPSRPRVRSAEPEYATNERATQQISGGIQVAFSPGQNRIELVGPGVGAALHDALQDWLKSRSK